MNAESNKIKDIFLEILMPVVDRLCKFGVFYSREVARVYFHTYLCNFFCSCNLMRLTMIFILLLCKRMTYY